MPFVEVTVLLLPTEASTPVSDRPIANAAATVTGPSLDWASGVPCVLLPCCPRLVAWPLPRLRWLPACVFALLPLFVLSLAPPASASPSVTALEAPCAFSATLPAEVTLRDAVAFTLSFVLVSAKARPSATLPVDSALPAALVLTLVSCVAVASTPRTATAPGRRRDARRWCGW